ncbi:motility-associated protein [Galenea microaerophila]
MISKILAVFIIFGSLIGGFLMEGGNLAALWHPAELVIIIGMGIGVFLGSTPLAVWKQTLRYIGRYFSGGMINRRLYDETIQALGELGKEARVSGVLSLEEHLDSPESSPIFSKYPALLKNEMVLSFIVDNLSFILLNPPKNIDMGEHLESQIEAIISAKMEVPKATGKVSNLMPGFGIIAAVMGVILTMRLLGGEMDVGQIGESIGAALVGTLTGIFVAFGVIAPFTHGVEIIIRQEQAMLEMVAGFLELFSEGVAPTLALEVGKQRIPPEFRPHDE